MKPIIDLINVKKSFGDVVALKGVSAQIMEGEFFDIGIPKEYYKFCDWYRLTKENRG